MSPHLHHLAARLAGEPDFLACALAEYARSDRLDDAGLAARLGCPVETLMHLRLCRAPRAEPPSFGQDVEQIARRFAVDAAELAAVARRGLTLWSLRPPADAGERGDGFLLAARDPTDLDESRGEKGP